MKSKLGWIILIFFSISPVIPWYFAMLPFSLRFYSMAQSFLTVGELLGLIGVAMFSLNLVLSTRLELFEDYFGGVNNVYIAHHILGGLAFILLMLHPLFLAGNRSYTSVGYAAALFNPIPDITITLGIIGLGLMMLLLILTFFVKLHYQLWLFTHKFLGAAFFLGALHAFLVPSDISRFAFLEGYMLFLVSVGCIAFVYRTLLGKFFVHTIRYTVTEIAVVGNKVLKISMTPDGKPMTFNPGQFLFIRFLHGGVKGEVHPFSISSLPTDDTLAITIKAEGDYTTSLSSLQPGAQAIIEGAFGRFDYLNTTYTRQIWIAGGIGITPFMGMARSLVYHPEYGVDLYYSLHDDKDAIAIYMNELQSLSSKHASFRIIPFYSVKQGRLSVEEIKRISGDIHHADIFLCGPPPMMHSLKNQFRQLSITAEHMHSEEFSW